MGTRGTYGIRHKGRDYIAYNHFDSYPSELGRIMVETVGKLQAVGLDEARKRVELMRVIDKKTKPTRTDVARLAKWTDLSVSNQSPSDWYCLTRGMQGDIMASLESGYWPNDSSGFMRDSLFCEWAYIINLDDEVLEVYKGFNQNIAAPGRYTGTLNKDHGYCGVALVGKFPMASVTAEDVLGCDVPETEDEEA